MHIVYRQKIETFSLNMIEYQVFESLNIHRGFEN